MQVDDDVIIQGVKAGVVRNITLQSSDVIVTISLPKSIHIPKGSVFYIENVGIMGERAIKIDRSTETTCYNANDTIQGQIQQQLSISEGIGKFASSLNTSISISQKLDSIIVLLNKQTELLEKNQVKK